jgi:tRNA-dihydrouridine synthase
MDGVTDATFRRIVATQGPPDVTFTEFAHVSDISRGPEYLLDSLVYSEVERPIVAQIYGKDPLLFYQAAHVVCELGFDGLDINMGCPSRNVASSGSGAALIKTPDVAQAIIRAVKQGIQDWAAGQSLESAGLKRSRSETIRRMNEARGSAPIIDRRPLPWSVKTRLGCDAVVIDRWIEHLLEERPAAITIHGRTLAQMYRGEADWTAIASAADIAKGTDTVILGNGDVRSMNDAVRRVRESGVQGVLVGRATLGAPWFFRRKELVREWAVEQAGGERDRQGTRSTSRMSANGLPSCWTMPGNSRDSAAPTNSNGCANISDGTAKDFPMPRPCERVCSALPVCVTSKRR